MVSQDLLSQISNPPPSRHTNPERELAYGTPERRPQRNLQPPMECSYGGNMPPHKGFVCCSVLIVPTLCSICISSDILLRGKSKGSPSCRLVVTVANRTVLWHNRLFGTPLALKSQVVFYSCLPPDRSKSQLWTSPFKEHPSISSRSTRRVLMESLFFALTPFAPPRPLIPLSPFPCPRPPRRLPVCLFRFGLSVRSAGPVGDANPEPAHAIPAGNGTAGEGWEAGRVGRGMNRSRRWP